MKLPRNAHGFCPWVASHWGHPKHINLQIINMETYDIFFLKHKRDYFKLFLKIWTMRYRGDEPPKELLQQAHEIGHLVGISKKELKYL